MPLPFHEFSSVTVIAKNYCKIASICVQLHDLCLSLEFLIELQLTPRVHALQLLIILIQLWCLKLMMISQAYKSINGALIECKTFWFVLTFNY